MWHHCLSHCYFAANFLHTFHPVCWAGPCRMADSSSMLMHVIMPEAANVAHLEPPILHTFLLSKFYMLIQEVHYLSSLLYLKYWRSTPTKSTVSIMHKSCRCIICIIKLVGTATAHNLKWFEILTALNEDKPRQQMLHVSKGHNEK